MRPSLIRATATLVLGLVATSCGTEPSPGISITLGGQVLTLVQGANNTLTVDVARLDYQGNVMLAASGLPTGVSASFAPATLSGAVSTSTLTLTATGVATPGDASVTITATGDGVESSTATLALTVSIAGSFTITANPATTSVTRGATATTTVSVTRSGGFAQGVTLTATGLPAGVTASFNPATLTSSVGSSVVTFTATTSAALGAATVTIAGATTGLPNQTTNVGLTVQEVGSTTQLSIDFCSDEIPMWFAFQNEGGAWTRVIPDGNGTVTANVTSKFAAALVFADAGFTDSEVIYTTVAELAPLNGVTCVEESGGKTLNGTVANMGASNAASVNMAFQGAFISQPNTMFQLFDIPNGAVNLVASRSSAGGFNWMPDKVIVRRGLNIANNGTIPVLDWNAAEAATTTVSTLTLTGAGTDDVFGFNNFVTNPSSGISTYHGVWDGDVVGGSASFTSVPSASTVSGDMHALLAVAFPASGPSFRGATTYFRTAANKTIALGANISVPTVTTAATTPYLRHRVQLAAGEYTGAFLVEFSQSTKTVFMYVSQGYLGAAPTTWDITMPDFSSVPGWNNAWGLSSGAATDHYVQATTPGFILIEGIAPAEGTTVKFGAYDSFAGAALLSRTDARSRHVEKSSSRIVGRAFRKEQ